MKGEQFYRGLMRIINDVFAGYEFLVTASDKRRDLTRFANSEIHQNVSNEDTTISLLLYRNKKLLLLNTNETSQDALKKLRDQADDILENLPELPYDFKMPPIRMAFPYEKADPSMLDVPPAKRAEVFDELRRIADERNLKLFGYVASDVEEIAVMSSSGLFLYATYSAADYNVVYMNESGGSCYASGAAPTLERLDVLERAREVADLAGKNVPQGEIEPGEYTVVLGPEAVATLFAYFTHAALNGFYYEMGTSSAVKYLGKKIAPEFLNFKDDPKDERLIGIEFDAVGVARDTFPIVENGVLKNVLYSYGAALMFGKKPTGHTVDLEHLEMSFALNPVIEGGDKSVEEIFSMVDKGVYVHRFHYVNVVDPAELILTGMTRDGFFLVENGQITKALRNMRFNVNFYDLLSNLKALSKETRVVGAFTPTVAPYALFEGFRFTSKTDH